MASLHIIPSCRIKTELSMSINSMSYFQSKSDKVARELKDPLVKSVTGAESYMVELRLWL